MGLYEKNKGKLRTGDCLLWRSKSVLGWAIRLFSQGRYNHAGLVIRPREGSWLMDRRVTIEALGNGVVLRLLSERLQDYKGEVWVYPLLEGYSVFRKKLEKWSESRLGIPYDYESLFRQVFGRVSTNAEEYFCSELVFSAYEEVGMLVESVHAPRPGDLPLLKVFGSPYLLYTSSS